MAFMILACFIPLCCKGYLALQYFLNLCLQLQADMEATSRCITIKIYRNNVYSETKQYADPPKRAGDILDRLRDI